MKTPAPMLERVFSAIAISIALMALAVSVLQTSGARQHIRISARPHLSLYQLAGGEDERLGVVLVNNGPGVAILKRVEIYLDRKRIENWDTLAKAPSIEKLWGDNWPSWQDFTGDHTLNVNDRMELLGTPHENVVDMSAFKLLLDERLSLKIERCSVYDECLEVCLGAESRCDKLVHRI